MRKDVIEIAGPGHGDIAIAHPIHGISHTPKVLESPVHAVPNPFQDSMATNFWVPLNGLRSQNAGECDGMHAWQTMTIATA